MIDFTDSANPQEIGYFDRGPVSSSTLVLGGLWSSYYFNGFVYGSEIARGLDVWALTPTEHLSQNEIDAAAEVELERLTPQHQPQFANAPSFAVVRSYVDQLVQAGAIDERTLAQVQKFVDRAERFSTGPQAKAAQANLHALANQLDGERYDDLRAALRGLAGT